MSRKLYCYSKADFDNLCIERGYIKRLPSDIAFISIVGTEECQQYYLKEKEEHVLPTCLQVFNVEFDDLSEESREWHDHIFYGISDDQAKELAFFIDRVVEEGKDIYVHCRAGQSRSQGVVEYITRLYPEVDWETRLDNPCLTPNLFVTSKLVRVAREFELGAYKE